MAQLNALAPANHSVNPVKAADVAEIVPITKWEFDALRLWPPPRVHLTNHQAIWTDDPAVNELMADVLRDIGRRDRYWWFFHISLAVAFVAWAAILDRFKWLSPGVAMMLGAGAVEIWRRMTHDHGLTIDRPRRLAALRAHWITLAAAAASLATAVTTRIWL